MKIVEIDSPAKSQSLEKWRKELGPIVLVSAVIDPFSGKSETRSFTHGTSIQEIVDAFEIKNYLNLYVWLGDDRLLISEELWGLIRPKAGTQVLIKAFATPYGGGGGKGILRTLLIVGVLAASAFAGPALAGFLGISATFGQAAIGIGGLLLVNALVPPSRPSAGQAALTDRDDQGSPSLFLDGARNQARIFSAIPMVLGFHRQVPMLAATPYTINLGRKNVLRQIFCWGYGRLDVSDIRIGNTPIEEFEGVRVQTRSGRDADDPLTVYPSSVDIDEFQIKLKNGVSNIRLTGKDTTRIGVDFTFAGGLFEVSKTTGRQIRREVEVQIRYRKEGETTWQNMPNDAESDLPSGKINSGIVVFKEKFRGTLRHGFEWEVPERNFRWEVQVKRQTNDTNDTNIVDELFWTSLKSFRYEYPIAFDRQPLAVTGIRIRASDQLSSSVDELSGMCKSYALDWDRDSQSWVTRVTNNPASLFRHVLQGPARETPLPGSRLDVSSLEEWHEFCENKGFTYNKIHDYEASTQDVLEDICRAGKATVVDEEKIRIIIDKPQSKITPLITPKNSAGFRFEKAFVDVPHAIRVSFPNEQKDYREDERTVYASGYNENNATTFETLDLPGVTNPRQIHKLALYYLEVATFRKERWSFKVDFEHITFAKGDRIAIGHDVLIKGETFGRITEITRNNNDKITHIEIDETVTMVASGDYGVVIRSVDRDDLWQQRIVASNGETNILEFTNPYDGDDIEVGDLFSFGDFDEEVIDGLVIEIQPQNDYSAEIICVPYAPEVFTRDDEEPPEFESGLLDRLSLPRVQIKSIKTGRAVLETGISTSEATVAITVKPIDITGAYLQVQFRPSDARDTWQNSPVKTESFNSITVGGVSAGDYYDFRVRWNSLSLVQGSWRTRTDRRVRAANVPQVAGAWSEQSNVEILAVEDPPDALNNLRISAVGGMALAQWDSPPDIVDYQVGGIVRFRWSQSSTATWSNSLPVGQVAAVASLQASLQLRSGTYFARMVNAAGQESSIASATVKQASALEFIPLVNVVEEPAFSGAKIDMAAVNDSLQLANLGLIDDQLDFDSIPDLDTMGGLATSGSYQFANYTDLGLVRRVRVTAVVDFALASPTTFDEIFSLIDDWEDFDGVEQAAVDICFFERHTDDDPTGAPTWSEWQRLDSAEFEARAFQFKIEVKAISSGYNCVISELGAKIEELS